MVGTPAVGRLAWGGNGESEHQGRGGSHLAGRSQGNDRPIRGGSIPPKERSRNQTSGRLRPNPERSAPAAGYADWQETSFEPRAA